MPRNTFRALMVAGLFAIVLSSALASAQVPEEDAPIDGAKPGDIMVVTNANAPLFTSPNDSKRTAAGLKKGRRIQISGPEQGGFYPLSTKAGGRVWIRKSDVTSETIAQQASPDYEPVQPPPKRAARGGGKSFGFGIERVTYDLGGSTGSVQGGGSYTEINLGLNLFFGEFLSWRNAVFGRFMSGVENIYGLDTSARGLLSLSGSALGLSIFAGPGYRFVTRGTHVPFAEAGLVVRLAGFSIGGGVKTLLTSWVHSGRANETQFFLILAGGGSL